MSNDLKRPDDMEREPPNWKLLVIILVVGATALIGAMLITWYRRR